MDRVWRFVRGFEEWYTIGRRPSGGTTSTPGVKERLRVTIERIAPTGETVTLEVHDLRLDGSDGFLYIEQFSDDDDTPIPRTPTRVTRSPDQYLGVMLMGRLTPNEDGETHRVIRTDGR